MHPVYQGRSYRNEVVNKIGIVTYWRMGDAVGTTAGIKDEVGLHPGTATGTPTFGVTGTLASDPNGAMSLDGSTNNFTFSNANLPYAASARTFLFKALFATGGGNRVVLAYGTATTTQLIDLFHEDSSGKLQNFTPSGGVYVSDAVFSENVWRDFAVTYDGTNWLTYANAIPGTPAAQTLNTTAGGSFNMLGGDGAPNYIGSLDEFAIISRALTGQEADRLYRLSRGF